MRVRSNWMSALAAAGLAAAIAGFLGASIDPRWAAVAAVGAGGEEFADDVEERRRVRRVGQQGRLDAAPGTHVVDGRRFVAVRDQRVARPGRRRGLLPRIDDRRCGDGAH